MTPDDLTSCIIQQCFQVQWVTAKQFKMFPCNYKGASLVSVAKTVLLDQLFLALDEELGRSHNVEELNALLEKTCVSTSSDTNSTFTLSPSCLQYLSESMIRKPLVALSIVSNLFSPCLPQLSESDVALSKLCTNALENAITRFQEDSNTMNKGIMLKLLSALLDSPDKLENLRSLVVTGTLSEAEMHLALIVRGGSPPVLLQSFCALEDPSSIFSCDGLHLDPRNAFLLQTKTGQHWLSDALFGYYSEMCEKSTELKLELLSQPLTQLLSPLLVLIAWEQQCCDETTLSLLTDTCKKISPDPIFERLGFLLERRATVTKWVTLQDEAHRKSSLLNKLDKLSTLRVLHETGCLMTSDQQEVESLLRKAKSQNIDDWEFTLFQGFHILASIIRLIWASNEENFYEKNGSTWENTNSPTTDSDNNFQAFLSEELMRVQNIMKDLNPLPFRLEVLENIFSLIFLRYENLYAEDATSDTDSEDDLWEKDSSTTEYTVSEHKPLPRFHKTDNTSKQWSTDPIKTKNNRGFVCTPIVIKEILNCLSECLVECNAAYYKQRKSAVIKSETSDVNVEKRMNILFQLTAEALWRLKLLLDLPRAVHCKHTFIPEPQRAYPGTESSSDNDEQPEERRKETHRRLSYTSHPSRIDHMEKSSESSSNTTGSMTSSGGRKASHRKIRAQKRLPDESDSIVRLLLANSASLITHCLSMGEVFKAQQIIEIFQLTNHNLKNEAIFLEMYEKLTKELCSGKKTNYSTSQPSSLQTMTSSLQAIRQAVSGGMNAAGISRCIEQTLTSAPRMHGFDRITSEFRCAAGLLSGLNAEVMAACDASLTLGCSRDISLSLLDVLSQHWTSHSMRLENEQTKGFSTFLSRLMELYRNFYKFHLEDIDYGLPSILLNWEIALNILRINEGSSIWTILNETFLKFEEEHSTSNSRCQSAAIRNLVKICGESFSYYESRQVTTTEYTKTTYLQNVFWYLQTLASLITKCSHDTKDECSPFSVLAEGWSDLLGRLVFELDAPLGHVERVATRLQLDLLHAVVSACCPSIHLAQPDAVFTQLPAEYAWAKISLNVSKSVRLCENSTSPGPLASTLLSQLLDALKKCCNSPILSHEDFTLASHNSEVINILNETSKLTNVDLDTLSDNLERVSFLVNISNLLLLHGLIVLGANCGLVSSHYSERRCAYNCVGYHLGRMGFVSLSRVQYQLLGCEVESTLSMQDSSEQYWSIGEKRAIFCLSQGTIHSPVIQVIDPKCEQLRPAIVNYLCQNVRVEGSVSEGCFSLVIPRLVLHFFGISSPSSLEHAEEARDEPIISQQVMFPQVTYLARDCTSHLPLLLDFLQSYVTGQLQLQVADWADAWTASSEDSTDFIVTIEEASLKMGVILPSTIQVISCESIQSSLVDFEDTSIDIGWENRFLSNSIQKYLSHQCWLISLLATKLRQDAADQTCQTGCLDRLLLEHRPYLAPLAGGNVTLASLQPWHVLSQLIWPVLDKFLAEQQEIECVKLVQSLPELCTANDVKLQMFRDIILYQMASQPPVQGIDKPWCLAMSLGTAELRARCVLHSIQFWPGPESIDILKAMLGETTLIPATRALIINMLHQVSIYQQVHQVLCYYQASKHSSMGWNEVRSLSEVKPGQVLQSLIEAKQYRLCLPWAELHGIPYRAQHLVDASFISLLLETETSDFSAAEKLLTSVPVPQAISICRRLLGSLTSLRSLRFLVCFTLEKCQSWLKENLGVWSCLQLWSVGISVLSLLPEPDQIRDRVLASQPHLLLEQLLMNSRLAILDTALDILRTADLSALPATSPAQPIAVDAMLRQYATKALDFRVSRRAVLPELPPSEDIDELLQSLPTGSTGSGPIPFVMPAIAPSKNHWVPNDEVTECMSCLSVSFSMFNRRHHCRRCGRVVCGACSTHRAKVEGYGDLLVRTCDDCNQQMHRQTEDQLNTPHSEFSSRSSQQLIEWRLLGEEPHDSTVREEFGFEHAPSVGLCLSILALHSEHAAAQPRFLLKAADHMLQLLIPSAPGFVNPELDYSLVIRMARSLVVAAKVRYAKSSLNSGVAHCDRLLGQVDLLSLLVRSECASLLPVEPLPLSGHALRHLRDRLVAAELWPLALEVSTKAGLERGGVWAAWGKACLRSGQLLEAREHLAHCLQTPMSAQDPSPAPLLMEIINILVESNYSSDAVKRPQYARAPALAVLHTLASLTDISQGKLVTPASDRPLFYQEIQYYLRTYGSPAATLSFFLSHSDILSALLFVKERNIEPDAFAESLYKPCLRQGMIEQLHQEMRNIDPTLELWKDTLLHVGRLLENQGLLHSLYQLQLFAHDLVRAAMTCIRFYHANARCYSELAPEYLHKARSHLEKELSVAQWKPAARETESPPSPSVSSESSSSAPECQLPLRLPARQLDHHVSTICRQLEVAKFLQQCESDGRSVMAIAAELRQELSSSSPLPLLPTLFGNSTVRALVSALLIVCGKNVEEGFGIAFRVIQEFHLRPLRVYGIAAEWLTRKHLWQHIEQLVNCIRSSGSADSASCSDELLLQCMRQIAKQTERVGQPELLLKLIVDQATKIQAHMAFGQLKSAYLLAVKLGRSTDVHAVLIEAEKSNQTAMIRICKQWLAQQKRKVPN